MSHNYVFFFIALLCKSFPSAWDSHNWGRSLSSTWVHVKLSKVFHWAGPSDTLPKDPHRGSRAGLLSLSQMVFQLLFWVIPAVVATKLGEGSVCVTMSNQESENYRIKLYVQTEPNLFWVAQVDSFSKQVLLVRFFLWICLIDFTLTFW